MARFINYLLLVVIFLVISNTSANEDTTDSSLPERCSEEEAIDSTIRVASLRVEEVKIPLIIAAIILIVIIVKIGWHHPRMSYLSSKIPESLILVTIGTFFGGLIVASFRLDECNRNHVFPIRFTPQLFFIFLLPPIVFASGYFMNLRSFFENFITIIIFALIGTIWNAFALGFTLFGLSKAGLMSSDLSIPSALLFGTISAAVDPVAVLAVFDEIHVNKLLHILVFGESLLNDAVTIVLFQVLGAFANIEFDEGSEHNPAVDVVLGFVQFFVVVFASIAIGIIFGCGGVLLTRISHHVHVLEPIMLYVVGFVSYIFADLFAFSGIVSLITCAIIMKHYVASNIAWKSNITFKYTLKMLNIISEMIIFMFLGIALYDAEVHNWDTGLVLWTLLFALIFRPIGVVVLSLLVNLNRFHKINAKQIFIMSYSGLRGAVAFSLALTRIFEPGFEGLPEEEKTVRRSMLTAITVLLLFTVFIQGTTIKPLVQFMGVELDVSSKTTMNRVIHKTAIDHVATGLEDITGHMGFNLLKEFFLHIDVKYLRKIFERNTEAIDEEIIRKFQTLQIKETRSQLFENAVIQDDDKLAEERFISRNKSEDTLSTSSSVYDDSCVPTLDEVLKTSYLHPHDDHFMHVLSRDEHEIQDHHLERFKIQHRVKQRAKKRSSRINGQRRRRTTLGKGYSAGSKRLEEIDLPEFTNEPNVSFTVGRDNIDENESTKI